MNSKSRDHNLKESFKKILLEIVEMDFKSGNLGEAAGHFHYSYMNF